MAEPIKTKFSTKWFIDWDGAIRSIAADTTEQDDYVLDLDKRLVYHIEQDGGIFEEYTLWDTLHELADAIEPHTLQTD